MSRVIKESFYEVSIKVDEEFDNAEVKVLDLKKDKSRIKLISNKET